MTKPEFLKELRRLAHKRVTLTVEQQEAFYRRFGAHDAKDWINAVESLLLLVYFPKPEQISDMLAAAREQRQALQKARRRQEGERFLQTMARPETDPHNPTVEASFAKLCAAMIIAGVKVSAKAKVTKWLEDHSHVEWAKATASSAPKQTIYESLLELSGI